MDLTGIKKGNTTRLNSAGIFTVLDFYNASGRNLQAAFHSIIGHDWFLRLHGYEADGQEFARRSFGNSFALPVPYSKPEELAPILAKLVEKTGFRLRTAGYHAGGVHVSLVFRDWSFWHHGQKVATIFDSRDIFKIAFKILSSCPNRKPVHTLAVSVFNLEKNTCQQLGFFDDRKEELVKAMDKVNKRWGDFVICPASMMETASVVHDRIAFGRVRELEESVLY
jgi:DNA polymerase-4